MSVRALITGGGGQLASDLERAARRRDASRSSHAELDIADADARRRARSTRSGPTSSSTARRSTTSTSASASPSSAWAVNVARRARAGAALRRPARSSCTCRPTTSSTGAAPSPTARTTCPTPRSIYAITKLAGEHAALAYGAGALVVRAAGLYGLHGSASKGGNFVQRMLGRAREQGALRMVADQRLQPTFTADLAAALVDAVERDAAGVAAPHRRRRVLVARVHRGDHGDRRASTSPIEPVRRRSRPGGVDRPLNGVLARPRADALGPAAAAPLARALEDYMARAGVAAQPRVDERQLGVDLGQRGAVASRSEGLSSATGSGHSIPTSGSS